MLKLVVKKTIISVTVIMFSTQTSLSEIYKPKLSINGSGLEIPRMVSLKNSLTYMRSGPGKKYPITFEFRKKGYPLKIIAEYNNWRKVTTHSNLTGWIHTQLLSSSSTGIIIEDTFLKKRPSNASRYKAKLLQNLLVKIKFCELNWCSIEIIKNKVFLGWVKKKFIWGSTKNNF
ncbi:SH3 domain-containing protein [Alphaproteobacteria bacterium]|nr:SH3 domain-containing protein [Alphaproteobacteria bacterium]